MLIMTTPTKLEPTRLEPFPLLSPISILPTRNPTLPVLGL